MRIKLKDLERTKNITFSGEEPWLESIKKSFSNQILTPLHGEFHLEKKGPEQIFVRGSVSGKVGLPCALCGDSIPWDIVENFSANYTSDLSKEESWDDPNFIKVLASTEFESYAIDKDEIDLELVLNDAVQLSVPDHVTKINDEKTCLICGDDTVTIKSNLAATADASTELKTSPFGLLKNFKAKS